MGRGIFPLDASYNEDARKTKMDKTQQERVNERVWHLCRAFRVKHVEEILDDFQVETTPHIRAILQNACFLEQAKEVLEFGGLFACRECEARAACGGRVRLCKGCGALSPADATRLDRCVDCNSESWEMLETSPYDMALIERWAKEGE